MLIDSRLSLATVVLVCALLFLLHGTYGGALITPEPWRHFLFLSASWVLLGLLALLALIFSSYGHKVMLALASPRLSATIAWAFPCVMITSACYFSFSNIIALPGIAAFLLGTAMLRRRAHPAALITFNFLALGLLLGGKFAITPLDPQAADMLPVIIEQSTQFLSGNDPYNHDYSAVTTGPVYYLPLQWLFYMPLIAAGLDPRLLNIVALLGTIALFLRAARDLEQRALCYGLIAGMVASRPSIEMLVQGHVWPMWFLSTAYCASVASRRPLVASLLLGVLLAASQTMLLLLALAAAHAANAVGIRRAVLQTAISLAVYLAVVLPFAGLSFQFFLDHYLFLPQAAGVYSDVTGHNPVTQVSLMNLLAFLGLPGVRGALQVAAGLAGLVAIARRSQAESWYFLSVCGLSYLAAISLNMQVWKYYYTPGLLMILWGSTVAAWQARDVLTRPGYAQDTTDARASFMTPPPRSSLPWHAFSRAIPGTNRSLSRSGRTVSGEPRHEPHSHHNTCYPVAGGRVWLAQFGLCGRPVSRRRPGSRSGDPADTCPARPHLGQYWLRPSRRVRFGP
jgi:hypothetical protein